MIHRVVDWSARHPLHVLLFTVAAVFLGRWSLQNIPLDAIPDLSETQVIIYSQWDRSPGDIEDQVTYPIVTALLGAPKVKDVRGISDFGASYVYVVFEEGSDLYWARSRTLEYLAGVSSRIPAGVKTELGPDATGLGWVFQYSLMDTTGGRNLADLRALQDWYLRYHLQSVRGVAEVAPLGGFVREYQINLDPSRLAQFNVSVAKVVAAVRAGSHAAGGRLLEFSGREYMVRLSGYAKGADDLRSVSLGTSPDGSPIRVADVAVVVLGPALRRGAADLDGKGEAVSGIVIMRQGDNALRTIERVKTKLKDIAPGLPPGVKIVPSYDRSQLIRGTIANLKSTLWTELLIVAIVILVLLWHVPSAIIPILTIPTAVAIAFFPMYLTGMTADMMSLGGIAIAIGAMVDASIVVIEQTYKRIADWQRHGQPGEFRIIVINAIQEVARPSFFSLLVMAVAFLPVLALGSEEGKLFRPLALTKTFCIFVAALLTITLDPALRLLFTRTRAFTFHPRWLSRVASAMAVGKYYAEERHPVTRLLIKIYAPVVRWTVRWRWATIGGAVALVLLTIPVYLRLGSEFMPPLDEGSLLFMPTTMPGISLPEARRLLQAQDRILMSFPEVARVTGKVGRAGTATDPAPPSMAETVILLKPQDAWPRRPTWYSGWPSPFKPWLRHITADHGSTEELVRRMNDALQVPGVSNAWTMPIRNRIEMQNTGIRTPIGVKVSGPDPKVIQEIGEQVESVLRGVPGTRSAFAERTGSGYFLDVDLKRDELARYGLTVEDVDPIISSAVGGDEISTIVNGPERYGVSVRYARDFRSSVDALNRIAVPIESTHRQVFLGDLASIRLTTGPSMLRNDNGLLAGYVYADVAGRDLGGYLSEARRAVSQQVKLQPGYAMTWSGQYEAMTRVSERLKLVVPLTLAVIVLLLYWNTRSLSKTAIILLAIPFSAVGAIWLLSLLGYNVSAAVWVGLVALAGVDAGTGVFMLLYLDLAFEERRRLGAMHTGNDLEEAVVEGAARRIRPKFMTVLAMFAGLMPVMWAIGPGADVMKRIAAPMVGGILTSFLLELAVYPALYYAWKWHSEMRLITTLPL